MMLYAGLVLAVIGAGVLVYRVRASTLHEAEVVRGAVACVRREEVPVLAAECARTARERFGVELGEHDVGRDLERLEALLREEGETGTSAFREAFAGPGHPDRYVAVVGSLVGELLQRAGAAEWEPGPDAPLLRLSGGQRRTVSPFAEVIRTVRQPGSAPLACRVRGRPVRPRAATVS